MVASYELIDRFLRQQPGFICTICLAAAVNLPPSQISMATQRLRLDKTFALKLGVCSRCRAERMVIEAAGGPPTGAGSALTLDPSAFGA